ncbi:MAG: helix-turn-helix domain-containing protein, partial [Christensenellales bacterium]
MEYITAIAKHQAITTAANYLHITQPALSIYLKNLEGRLGLPLFNRVGRKFVPTNVG